MKRIVLIVLAMLSIQMAQAQLTDTVTHRNRNYYYSHWYDTCQCMYNGTDPVTDPSWLHIDEYHMTFYGEYAHPNYTASPLDLLGVAVMVNHNSDFYNHYHQYLDTNYGEEYVYVAYYNSATNQMQRLDSARWDTLQPKTMRLVLTETPENYWIGFDGPADGVAYCRVYEAYFEKPVTVEGQFYIIGSFHGSEKAQGGWSDFCQHKPVAYANVIGGTSNSSCCLPCRGSEFYYSHGTWSAIPCIETGDGPFLPIIAAQNLLEANPVDPTMGRVTGGGLYMDSTNAQIEALPSRGHVFSHWNDSVTDNPRTIFVTSDTVFTAYFDTLPLYRVEVQSNDEELGSVVGGAPYYEGEEAVLQAMPNEWVRFVCWNDSVTDNPRRVVVTQDTAFVAIFVPINRYRVDALANDSDRGRVEGGGVYTEGDVVTLTALPWTAFGFLQWNDGDRSNPRQFVLTQDTVFTAIFVSRDAIEDVAEGVVGFQLHPNPASNEVRCVTVEGFGGGTLTVVDAAGREVLRKVLARETQSYTFNVADYPAGTYFVTLSTPEGTSTQRLVVE